MTASHATTGKRRPIGIALRMALLTWLVSLVTLIVFVAMIIPQQKKAFLANLESKANSVAVALHDAAAGAAINEDFASVVSTGMTMVAGDPDLDFLMVIKNDGYALIFQRSGWRMETETGTYWRPEKREVYSHITRVPMLDLRVFHFAQPFDYSGLQWGWIHVGISLTKYDWSVAAFYRSTAFLALGCIALSLLFSLVYSRQLVRPILRLREIVERIASGDLTVRADVARFDEVGSLAESVNTMTEALLRRGLILESVRFAAQQFLTTEQWKETIFTVLARIGRAANVGRAYVFENFMDHAGRLCCAQQNEWSAEDVNSQLQNPALQKFCYKENGFAQWVHLLDRNEIIAGPVGEMSAAQRAVLESQGIRSIIIIPVFVEGAWWGFLGLDDCLTDRQWTDAEKDSLRAVTDMLGATITRQGAQEALLEAKATLEQRVLARTRELEDQVKAKENALIELAEAQGSLLEMSRAAGMAEVATGVLHNVGNVLNSVNVSCTLIMDQLRQSHVGKVSKLADLMSAPEGGLVRFLTEDHQGRQVPMYLEALGKTLDQEHATMIQEAVSLRSRIDHIKDIVAMQQSYGRVSGVRETISLSQIMDDVLKLNADNLARNGIKVHRQYEPVPAISVDKHKVLQILLNLIHNAQNACVEYGHAEKNIHLKIFNQDNDRIFLKVADNGAGIPPEDLIRIFQHGYTTRSSGHGFGLHIAALAALELGGNLTAHSNGPGTGAEFTLELPCRTDGT